MRIRPVSLMIIASLCAPAAVEAYTCARLLGDPRAMALGGAYAATASGALGVWSNPAAVARMMVKEAAITGMSLSSGRRLALAAVALGGKRHGWFFGARWAGVADIDRYTVQGERDGAFSAGDMTFAVGYARALSPLTFVGARAKLLTSHLDDERAWGTGIDVGLIHMPLPPLLKLGATIHDLGTFQRWTDRDVETTPAAVRAGIAIGLVQGKVSLNTEFEQVLNGSSLRTLLGLELKPGNGLVMRVGLSRKLASFGIGLSVGRTTLDLALVEDALEVRPTTSVSLSAGF
jgi:hypothetical protein